MTNPLHVTPPPKATVALSAVPSWQAALDEVCAICLPSGEASPDLVLLFACPAWADAFPQLLQALRRHTGTAIHLGCCASGFLAAGQEVEDAPGLAMMALWLPGANLYPMRLHQEHLALLNDGSAWRDVNGLPTGEVRSWLMFAEPFRIDTQELIRALGQHYPQAPIVGGIASGMVGERQSRVFLDDQVYDEGGVALGIGGPYVLEPMVSQGCDPIGETWTITETDRNHLVCISNRPALDVLQDTLTTLPSGQREQARRNLLVGLAANEYQDAYERGDFLIRGILGIDPKRGSIAVGGVPRPGQTMQFQLRSAEVATLDLSRALADVAAEGLGDAVAAVLCTCDGRGKSLFGTSHHDAAMVQAALPGIPIAGAFCLGEIGPMGTRTALHGFTATLGVLRQQEVGDFEYIAY
jgi:small ligand-binding sensory domain FIST